MKNSTSDAVSALNNTQPFYWVLILSSLLLTGCGNNTPELVQFKAFDERFTTVLDTKDPDKLNLISEIFFDRSPTDSTQADFSFDYMFDVTTATGSDRWGCTKNGYCREKVDGATPNREIFYVERYKELFKIANLN